MRLLWLLALILVVLLAPLPAQSADRGNEDNYWRMYSVVLAEVLQVRESHDLREFDLRPIGTMSGEYDAGTQVDFSCRTAFHFSSHIPQAGDLVLVVVRDTMKYLRDGYATRGHSPSYRISTQNAEYMPLPGLPLVALNETADRRYLATLSQIQRVRSKPFVCSGKGGEYWQDHSVIYAEVEVLNWAGISTGAIAS